MPKITSKSNISSRIKFAGSILSPTSRGQSRYTKLVLKEAPIGVAIDNVTSKYDGSTCKECVKDGDANESVDLESNKHLTGVP